MKQSLLINGKTHPGKRRKDNQDAFIFRRLWSADNALLAVIDGVGGYNGGEKAAAIAKECIEQYMQVPRGDTLTMLREAVVFANNKIVEEREKDRQVSEMCCVLTAAVADVTAGYIYYTHVGDTRLYRFRNGVLQKLTRDHSFVGIREDAGELSELEAMHHPHRNQILREVGSAQHRIDDEDFIEYGKENFLPGDILLLCSDGLTDMITQQQVTAVMSAQRPLTNKVNDLVALANEMGGYDNITVILLQHQKTAKPAPAKNEVKESVPKVVPSKKKSIKQNRLWAIPVLVIVAIAGWYFVPVKKLPGTPGGVPVTNQPNDSSAGAGNFVLPAIHRIRPAVPGPVSIEKTDTLRITATQNLEDLERYADSTGKTIVLVPATNHTQFAAIEITARSARPGDTLQVKNLRLKDFETGFNVHIPVKLKTENLVFENIRYPFSYLFKYDNRYSPVLLMNTMKQ